MEISIIAPVWLQEHAEQMGPLRFCLAHEALRDDDYKKYFIKQRELGNEVILDNGVFETEGVGFELLYGLIREIKPATVIAPDHINAMHPLEELEIANTFASEVYFRYPSTRVMWVPQVHASLVKKDNDSNYWLEWFRNALETTKCGYVGICRDFVYSLFGQFTNVTDQELNRLMFVTVIKAMELDQLTIHNKIKWHFLGMSDTYPELIQYYDFVDTMDTAWPIWKSMELSRRPRDFFTNRSRYFDATVFDTYVGKLEKYRRKANQLRLVNNPGIRL